MKLAHAHADSPGPRAPAPSPPAPARRPAPPARIALGYGLVYGLVGGLLGALQVLGVALAIALNQQQIMRYQDQYVAYQQCLRTNPTPALCQSPTNGVLTVSAIWLLFLGACLTTFVLSQIAYALAARSTAVRTVSRSAGFVAALIAGTVGWLLYLTASVASVFAQASPLTMTAPPPGVDTSALHLGAAIGNALVDALTLLPTLAVAGVAGLIAVVRVVRGGHSRVTDAPISSRSVQSRERQAPTPSTDQRVEA